MLSTPRIAVALALAAVVPAQAQTSPVAQYFATEVTREDMVSIPMRDGARLAGVPRRSTLRWQVTLPPLVTSNTFLAGHKIRISVTSSSFPVYERNLNTGGPNYNEKDPVIAHTVIQHGPAAPSAITLTVVPAR